ncbi:unnamed protein product [Coccothraustes coccothraustes]
MAGTDPAPSRTLPPAPEQPPLKLRPPAPGEAGLRISPPRTPAGCSRRRGRYRYTDRSALGNVQFRLSHVGRALLLKASDYFTDNLVNLVV